MKLYYIEENKVHKCLEQSKKCSHNHYFYLSTCLEKILEDNPILYHINGDYVIQICANNKCTFKEHFKSRKEVVSYHKSHYAFNGVWRHRDDKYSSLIEDEIKYIIEEILSYRVIKNTRKVIHPYEVDIYLSDLELAIEVNGDHWHSNEKIMYRYGYTSSEYHKRKYSLCSEVGIDLAFIWESNYKQDRLLILKLLCDYLQFGRENKIFKCFDKSASPEMVLYEAMDRIQVDKVRVRLEKRYKKTYKYK